MPAPPSRKAARMFLSGSASTYLTDTSMICLADFRYTSRCSENSGHSLTWYSANLFQDFIDCGDHGGHDRLNALAREQRTFVVREAVRKAAGVFHHRREDDRNSSACQPQANNADLCQPVQARSA
ncbi:hypothetical protein INR49_021900 [Caranx melampygus]|nr:hypothetical protein INR49_021900 [Caranx melampygus]